MKVVKSRSIINLLYRLKNRQLYLCRVNPEYYITNSIDTEYLMWSCRLLRTTFYSCINTELTTKYSANICTEELINNN